MPNFYKASAHLNGWLTVQFRLQKETFITFANIAEWVESKWYKAKLKEHVTNIHSSQSRKRKLNEGGFWENPLNRQKMNTRFSIS